MIDSPEKVNRTVFLGAKVTTPEYERLNLICKDYNYVMSDFIRFAIRKAKKEGSLPDIVKTHNCDRVIGIKLTDEESETLINYCKDKGFVKSSFVRQAIILAMDWVDND